MLEKIVKKAEEVSKKIEEGLEKNIFIILDVAGICLGSSITLNGIFLVEEANKYISTKNAVLNSLAQTASNPELYNTVKELVNFVYSPVAVLGAIAGVIGIGASCYYGWSLYTDIKHNRNLKYKEETK
jgi:hypothetical protein